jgi:hypothetical protein
MASDSVTSFTGKLQQVSYGITKDKQREKRTIVGSKHHKYQVSRTDRQLRSV